MPKQRPRGNLHRSPGPDLSFVFANIRLPTVRPTQSFATELFLVEQYVGGGFEVGGDCLHLKQCLSHTLHTYRYQRTGSRLLACGFRRTFRNCFAKGSSSSYTKWPLPAPVIRSARKRTFIWQASSVVGSGPRGWLPPQAVALSPDFDRSQDSSGGLSRSRGNIYNSFDGSHKLKSPAETSSSI